MKSSCRRLHIRNIFWLLTFLKFNSHLYVCSNPLSGPMPYKKGSPQIVYSCNKDRLEGIEKENRNGGLYFEQPIFVPCSIIPFLHSSSLQFHRLHLIRKHHHFFSHNQQTIHQNFMQFNNKPKCLLPVTLPLCLQGSNQPHEAR